MKKYTKLKILLVGLMLISSACINRSEKLYTEAYVAAEKGHYRIAADLLIKSADFENSNITKYKYLTEAARIIRFEIQDYERALRVFRQIILEAEDVNQRISAQEAITEIELENRLNYSQALEELQKLEPLVLDSKKKEKTRLKIAQTLYLTGQYLQALEEITAAEKYMTNYEPHFLKLKAEVYLAKKRHKESLLVYDELREKHNEFFKKENLYIATSIVYEEAEMFSEALFYLNKFDSEIEDKSYLELRLKRLKERLVNKPLFKGIRK